jgi:predicted SnoaL-like aldol condensation-catalyzing enzyme
MQIRKTRFPSTLSRLGRLLLLGASTVASVTNAQVPATACKPSPDANREVVLAFYRTGLVGLQPRAAFERYVAADFAEHKPDVDAGTREAAAAYLERLIKSVPQARWEILRTIAEGDHVFLHARFTPAPGAPAYAVADIFRLEDCRIVEHWDVVAGPPEAQRNPNPRF